MYKENHAPCRRCARRGFLVESPLQTWQADPLPVLPIGRRNPLTGCEGSGIFLAYSVFCLIGVFSVSCFACVRRFLGLLFHNGSDLSNAVWAPL